MDSKWFGGDPTVIQLTRRAPWDIQLTNGCTKNKRSPETLKCSQSKILRPATSTTCLSVKINRFVKFQHSRPTLFGFRKFQSFRHPCFFVYTLYEPSLGCSANLQATMCSSADWEASHGDSADSEFSLGYSAN